MDGEAGGSGAPLTAAHAPGLRGEPATRKGRQRDPHGGNGGTGTPTPDGDRARPRRGDSPMGSGAAPQRTPSGGVWGFAQAARKGRCPPALKRRWRGPGGSGLSVPGSAPRVWGGGDPGDPPQVGRGGGSGGGGAQGKGGTPAEPPQGGRGCKEHTDTAQGP